MMLQSLPTTNVRCVRHYRCCDQLSLQLVLSDASLSNTTLHFPLCFSFGYFGDNNTFVKSKLMDAEYVLKVYLP